MLQIKTDLYRYVHYTSNVAVCNYQELIGCDVSFMVVLISERHGGLFYNPDSYDRERLERFTEVLIQEMNCEPEYYVSENVLYTEINHAYEKLRTIENKKSFSDKHFVFNMSEKNYDMDLTFPSTEILNTYMEIGKRDELKKIISDFLKQTEGKGKRIKDYMRVLYYRLISAAITIQYSRGENMNHQLDLYFFDESVCQDIPVFQNWADTLVDRIVPNLTQKEIPELIQSVKKYICNNIDRNLTRESIANEAHISPSYLSRLFHKETGEKLSDYILRKRIGRAKEMLKNTDEKITFISQEIGYSNDSYFIKTFKSVTGMTPYEYRKMSRGKESD